jgi:hypothetical protein
LAGDLPTDVFIRFGAIFGATPIFRFLALP